MDFMTAVKTCFSKYVTFSGRAQRSEFWWFALFTTVCSIILTIVDSVLFGTVTTGPGSFEAQSDVAILSSLFSLAVFLPSISVAVRRLHDTDRSGWWWWLILVPIIGIIVLIVWYATRGTSGSNRFGEDPLGGAGHGGGGANFDEAYTPSSIPNVSND
ncbi:DUF805 domain-containing protein [Aliiroseovarius sp.]|uniref:DUF805 domain-containing protein n=1 Tax=Aliiroseovarius sp. TaxID=1872442 RepID=UPI003BAB0380